MDFSETSTVQVTCERGLAAPLNRELQSLNYQIDRQYSTGIEIQASVTDCLQICLKTRIAYSVLYQLSHFTCNNPDELYKHCKKIPWENILNTDFPFSITCRVNNDTIRDTRFPVLKFKDAVADRMMEKTGQRPNSGKNKNGAVLHLNWHKNKAWIFINLAGNKLTDRGYRKIPWKAPLREGLAAAILMTADLPVDKPFINPMCGSGTLAIEAALILRNSAPGLLRDNYGFKFITGFDEDYYKNTRSELNRQKTKAKLPRIIASDINPEAIEAAKQNARTAGVDHLIEFYTCDFADTCLPEEDGTVIMNPEYGERLGEIKELEKTYKRIGDWFKQQCTGNTCYVFTGNRELSKKIGLKTSSNLDFFNAKIPCKLLKYICY